MAFENVGHEADQQMEQLGKELLKMGRSVVDGIKRIADAQKEYNNHEISDETIKLDQELSKNGFDLRGFLENAAQLGYDIAAQTNPEILEAGLLLNEFQNATGIQIIPGLDLDEPAHPEEVLNTIGDIIENEEILDLDTLGEQNYEQYSINRPGFDGKNHDFGENAVFVDQDQMPDVEDPNQIIDLDDFQGITDVMYGKDGAELDGKSILGNEGHGIDLSDDQEMDFDFSR